MTLKDGKRKEGEEAVSYGMDMEFLSPPLDHQPSTVKSRLEKPSLPIFQAQCVTFRGVLRVREACSEVAKKSGDKLMFTFLVPGFESNENNAC